MTNQLNTIYNQFLNTMSTLTKYITSEQHLSRVISYYLNLNIRPILDYAVEFNTSSNNVNDFCKKKQILLKTYPNMYHSLKLSSLNFQHDKLLDIMECAKDHRVKLLVDAENFAIQHIIDTVTNSMIANRYDTTLFKTYQMYRTDTMDRLFKDIEEYRRCGFEHNIKLVRGAYLFKDSKHDIIYPNKSSTDTAYNEATKLLLDVSKMNPKMNVIFATHNSKSFDLIKNINQPNVFHASLMGMDTPFRTGEIQKMVHVPFGPYHKTIPYLFRRLVENNLIMDRLVTYKHSNKYRKIV